MAPGLTRIVSGVFSAVFSASMLALGTSAAPGRHVTRAHPRLHATPATLVAATKIAPGDRIERLVELRVRGRGRIRRVYFQASARKSSALDTDSRSGLQVSIDGCTKKWRTRGLVSSCPGKQTVVLAQRSLVGRTKLKLGTLTRRHAVHLRLVLVLPAGAPNALQAQATSATYRFIGTS